MAKQQGNQKPQKKMPVAGEQGIMPAGELFQKALFPLAAILLLTFVSFLPSLKNEFTNWDETPLITDAPLIHSLSPAGIIRIFSSFHFSQYHPLTTLSYAVNYFFSGVSPAPYIAGNILLHLLNCVLVFWLVFLLCGFLTRQTPPPAASPAGTGSREKAGLEKSRADGKGILAAFIAALLFGIHPLHVESVTWAAERKDVLYSFFFLASLVSYVYYCAGYNRRYLRGTLVFFTLSLLSKVMAVTLPLILLLFDYFIFNRLNPSTASTDRGVKGWPGVLKEKILFFALSGIFAVINLFAQTKSFTGMPLSFGFGERFTFPFYILFFHLSKTVFPYNLSAVYPYPDKAGGYLPLIYYSSPLIIGAVFSALYLLRKRAVFLSFGSLFFLVNLLPVLQIIVPPGTTINCDRFNYIPSLGLFLIIGLAVSRFYSRYEQAGGIKAAFTALLVMAVGALSITTWKRTQVWKDSMTLWNDTLGRYPAALTAWDNRGMAHLDRKEFDAAISDFNKAISINANDPDSFYDRGLAYLYLKNIDYAMGDFNRALALNPRHAEAYNNRAVAHLYRGEMDLAIQDFQNALAIKPDHEDAKFNLELLLRKRQQQPHR